MNVEEELLEPCSIKSTKSKKLKKVVHMPQDSPDESPLQDEMVKTKFKRRKLLLQEMKLISQIEQEVEDILGSNIPPDEEEKDLEMFVLGGSIESDLEEEKPHCEKKEDSSKRKMTPAWQDDDDETLLVKEKAKDLKNCHRSVSLRGNEKYSDYVQEKFIKIMGAPKWAELDRDDKSSDDEIEDDLLQKTGNFIIKSDELPKGNISFRKCPSMVDRNMKASLIKTVEFHPTSRVALVASTNGIANLFQVDGKVNAKIQSVQFENFPIHTAHFTRDGNEIIAGSNKFVHMFSYDMFAGKISKIPWQKGMEQRNIRRFQMSPDGKYLVVNGRYGHIHLMATKSKEWIGSLKMNGEVIAVTFNPEGSRMYTHGSTGEIYVWDMNTRKCIYKFIDEGCISGTALAVSPNDQFLATGSDSGVVNIYDNKALLNSSNPRPLKSLLNLSTEVTHIKFNSSSELLAMASSYKPDSIKLVHFPSMTVYANFPSKDSIKHPSSLDISVNSGYLCIGNNIGTALIYRLKHYKNY